MGKVRARVTLSAGEIAVLGLECVSGTLVLLVVAVLVGPVVLATALWKGVALLAAKWRHGPDARLLDAIDIHVGVAKATSCDVFIYGEFEGVVDYETFFDRYDRAVRVPTEGGGWEYDRKVVCYWESCLGYPVLLPEKNFDMKWHLTELLDEETGEMVCCSSDRELELVIKKLLAYPTTNFLAQKKSPWRFYLLRSRSPADGKVNTVVVLQSSHAFSDPYAIINRWIARTLDSPHDTKRIYLSCHPKVTSGQLVLLKIKALNEMVRQALTVLFVRKSKDPLDHRRAQRRAIKNAGGSVVDCRRQVFTPPRRVVDLSLLKDIKRETGATVNTTISLAFLRAVARICADSRTMEEARAVGRDWSFSLGIPVSLWLPDDKVDFENRIAFARPTYESKRLLDADCARALDYVQETNDRCLVNNTWVSWWWFRVVNRFSPTVVFDLYGTIACHLQELFTIIIPCMRTIEEEVSAFGGNRTLRINGYPPVTGLQDLMACAVSYNGSIWLNAFATDMVLDSEEEADELLEMAADEIRRMHRELCKPRDEDS